MKITKVSIENYLCYYDVKQFELEPGLNIILGENGEGKTKFFEAIDWLFNGDQKNLEMLVSSKKFSEIENGESFNVSVKINIEQYDSNKLLNKSFLVTKQNNEKSISNFKFEGTKNNENGEREKVDGKKLLDEVFPSEIRRYSMFKGESELNIFKNYDALHNLIKSFSDAKYYEEYERRSTFMLEKQNKAVSDETKRKTKNNKEYERIESDLIRIRNKKINIQENINQLQEEITKTQDNINSAEKYVDNASDLKIINERIANIENDIRSTENKIDENFTKNLFDEKWLLVGFESVFSTFSEKISNESLRKREAQKTFDEEKGKKLGRAELLEDLRKSVTPLPVGVPSKSHMIEMISEEFCKVCNRPALKGTPEHEFMQQRLQDYLKSQEPVKKQEEETLFKNTFLEKLVYMKTSHEDDLSTIKGIETEIKERFDFNAKRKEDLNRFLTKLENEKKEREKIIGQSTIGSDELANVLKNYNGWQRDIGILNQKLNNLERDIIKTDFEIIDLEKLKESIELSDATNFLINTRNILSDIDTIFKDTKKRKFDEFLKLIEQKANEFFNKINVESFTGNIVLHQKSSGGKIKIEIELWEGDRLFYKPNQSLETSMHIAILFAISELASEQKSESFPMIFDAPISSFGETKSKDFLNLVHNTKHQKILLIKDFITTNQETRSLEIKADFLNVKRDKAFWIRLERPFDKNNLETLNTTIIPL